MSLEQTEKRAITFGITGEFITKTAREWFFIDHKPYATVEELLLGCMCGTDTDPGTLKLMAQDIIIGKAEFRGNSWDDSFEYVVLDEPASVNIFEEYCKVVSEKQEAEREAKRITNRYNTMLDALRLWSEGDVEEAVKTCSADEDLEDILIQIMSTYGECRIAYGPNGYKQVFFEDSSKPAEILPASTGNSILDDYFAQQVIEEKFGDSYGWLEPDGTFHEVEWCEHAEFAYQVIQERGWQKEFDAANDTIGIRAGGDFLTQHKRWVLLHNPMRGTAYVTRDEAKPMTKKQREFLYDYYTKRGMPATAKTYLEDV